jgi:hypothetical protein
MNKYAIAYCNICKEQNPIDIQKMTKGDMEITIAWCGVCGYVINLDDDIKIEWITEKWMNEHGWYQSGHHPKARKRK